MNMIDRKIKTCVCIQGAVLSRTITAITDIMRLEQAVLVFLNNTFIKLAHLGLYGRGQSKYTIRILWISSLPCRADISKQASKQWRWDLLYKYSCKTEGKFKQCAHYLWPEPNKSQCCSKIGRKWKMPFYAFWMRDGEQNYFKITKVHILDYGYW